MGVFIFIVVVYLFVKMFKNVWCFMVWFYMLFVCVLLGVYVIGFVCFAWTYWVMFVFDIIIKAWIKCEVGVMVVDVWW